MFWNRFGERAPVYPPFSPNAVYSNIGWTLIGYAVEKVTGKPVGEFIAENVWGKLGMKHTFLETPDDSLGFLPVNQPDWNASIGFEAP